MDFEYRPVSDAALALMRKGHNHPEMVATLNEIVAEGVPPAPENHDGEVEDVRGLRSPIVLWMRRGKRDGALALCGGRAAAGKRPDPCADAWYSAVMVHVASDPAGARQTLSLHRHRPEGLWPVGQAARRLSP